MFPFSIYYEWMFILAKIEEFEPGSAPLQAPSEVKNKNRIPVYSIGPRGAQLLRIESAAAPFTGQVTMNGNRRNALVILGGVLDEDLNADFRFYRYKEGEWSKRK